MNVRACAHSYVFGCVCVRACVRIRTYSSSRTHTYTHTPERTHTHAHSHTHTHNKGSNLKGGGTYQLRWKTVPSTFVFFLNFYTRKHTHAEFAIYFLLTITGA